MSVTVSIHSIDDLPVVFRNRGVIYLSKKLMAELNVSPGNSILCQFNDKKILLKTGLYIPDFFTIISLVVDPDIFPKSFFH